MRSAGYGLLVLGVLLLLVGLVNHFALRMNPVAHTSTIVLAVGAVAAVLGVVMAFFMGAKQA